MRSLVDSLWRDHCASPQYIANASFFLGEAQLSRWRRSRLVELEGRTSAASLAQPPWHGVLVSEIGLAKARLQGALFERHIDKIEHRARHSECNQDSDAPEKDYPPKQERQFREIHRIA